MITWLDGLLVLGGAAAGFVNTVAGGGSALTLPLLMMTGLDASQANGTNRIGVVLQSLTSTITFHNKGLRPWREVGSVLAASMLGSVAGALLATVLPPLALERLFGIVFLGLALAMIARPRWLAPELPADAVARRPGLAGQLAFFGVGFYGGLFQAGVGIPLVLVTVHFLRIDLVRSTAFKVGLVLLYSLGAFAIFLWQGELAWRAGLIIAVGGMVGSTLGARMALKGGAVFIRWMVALALFGTAGHTLGIW